MFLIGLIGTILCPIPLMLRLPARSTAEWLVCRALFDDMQAVKFSFVDYQDVEIQAEFYA